MRIAFISILALLPALAGCVDPNCDGKIIEVSTNQGGNPCGVSGNGTVDYSGCCPPGFDYIAQGTDGGNVTVICQEDCGLGSNSSVAYTADAVYIADAALDGVYGAVVDLSTGP